MWCRDPSLSRAARSEPSTSARHPRSAGEMARDQWQAAPRSQPDFVLASLKPPVRVTRRDGFCARISSAPARGTETEHESYTRNCHLDWKSSHLPIPPYEVQNVVGAR